MFNHYCRAYKLVEQEQNFHSNHYIITSNIVYVYSKKIVQVNRLALQIHNRESRMYTINLFNFKLINLQKAGGIGYCHMRFITEH